jgi:hypothetical protein
MLLVRDVWREGLKKLGLEFVDFLLEIGVNGFLELELL